MVWEPQTVITTLEHEGVIIVRRRVGDVVELHTIPSLNRTSRLLSQEEVKELCRDLLWAANISNFAVVNDKEVTKNDFQRSLIGA